MTALDHTFAHRELLDLRTDRDRARTAAVTAGTAADAMQRVAAGLDRALEPLRTALGPLEALHTSATWEGRAATASRDRLALHDERRRATLRSVEQVIAELETTAAIRRRTADLAWDDYVGLANQVRGLEDLLTGAGRPDRIR